MKKLAFFLAALILLVGAGCVAPEVSEEPQIEVSAPIPVEVEVIPSSEAPTTTTSTSVIIE